MSLIHEAESLASNPASLLPKLGGLGGGLLAVGGVFKMFTVVNEGEAGIRTHFGKPYYRFGSRQGQLIGVVQRGVHWHAPLAHSIKKVSIQNRAMDLKPIVTSAQNVQREIEASVIWRVSKRGDKPVRAFYRPLGGDGGALPDIVGNITGSALREIVDEVPGNEPIKRKSVEHELRRACRKDLGHYGVQLVGVTLGAAGESLGEMVRQSGSFNPAVLGALANYARELPATASIPGITAIPDLRIVTPPSTGQ